MQASRCAVAAAAAIHRQQLSRYRLVLQQQQQQHWRLQVWQRDMCTAQIAQPQTNLLGMTEANLQQLFLKHGIKSRDALKRTMHQVHRHGIERTEDLDVNSKVREALASEGCIIDYGEVISERVSQEDGTRKWLIRVGPGLDVETVFIPDGPEEKRRGVVCVSSQVGCTLACRFCHTGTQPVVRNLSTAQIVAQLMVARRALNAFPVHPVARNQVSNVVFMGQGEPLYNYRNVAGAVRIFKNRNMSHIHAKHICVSTSGLVPHMPKVASELGVCMALSLHAPNDELRSQLMDINRQFPLAPVMAAAKQYAEVSKRKLFIEYVMLNGVNDHFEHAHQLADLLQGYRSFVNLMLFNEWPGSGFTSSSLDHVYAFSHILVERGVHVSVRHSKGADIMAACGQLKSSTLNKPAPRQPQQAQQAQQEQQ